MAKPKVKNWRCRLLGHTMGFVADKDRPLDITRGCTRCRDPKTFKPLVRADTDPQHPDMVRVQPAEVERLIGYLEGRVDG